MNKPVVSRDNTPNFQAIFQSAPGLCLVLNPEFQIVAVSDSYLRATMTCREDILGRGIFDVFPDNPEDPLADGVRNLRRSLAGVLGTKQPHSMAVQKYDIRKPESEGGGFEVRYWRPVNLPIFTPDGEVVHIIHQVQDVTELIRLEQEEAVKVEHAHELESRAAQMETEVHQRVGELQRTNHLLEEANRQLGKLSSELEARVAERTAQLAESNARLEHELTERKWVEHQFLQSQKMEAVGRLAGGVAHDFNNLLTVIQGYSQLLLSEIQPVAQQREQLNEIYRASERAAALTRQLLAFSRQQLLEVRILDLNIIVGEMGKMLHRLIGEDIDMVTLPGKRLGRIKADPGQIEQIILNLAVNARDAMPRGGKLTIETANVEIDEAYARNHLSVKPGPYVMLAVSDTGVGMDANTQEHIFEPFFTTKALGKGTGLGLSTVYGVVKQSGGNIWVYSEIGRGTTFKIYLPRVDDLAESAPLIPGAANRLEGNETILLVEDEEAVRTLIRNTLSARGYSVVEARLGTEALVILRQGGKAIDLVLTDVVMPGMSGRELVEAVIAIHPDIKVLYMSGYTDDAILRHGVIEPGNHFIQKPFRPVDLMRKVREALDEPPVWKG